MSDIFSFVPGPILTVRSDLTSLIPILVQLLSNEDTFIGASDVLQEILNSSSFSDGSGTKTLTEPLLSFLETDGTAIVQQTLSSASLSFQSFAIFALINM